MLEVVQAGQSGKTRLLFDMHRLRKRVFRDRMGWDVTVTSGGLEVDQFDLSDTVYILGLDQKGRVIANWRLLPASGPTMIRDVWPEFLDSIDMPADDDVWEVSRFAVSPVDDADGDGDSLRQVNRATQELFCGLTEICIQCGINSIFTMHDALISRLLRRLDCAPYAVSAPRPIGGRTSYVSAFRTDEAMLARLKLATGIRETLVAEADLPPVLAARAAQNWRRRETRHPRRRSGQPLEARHG